MLCGAGARRSSLSSQLALRGATATLASVYVQRFWTAGARLLASELVVEDVALDLLWRLRDGRLRADEIKTGMWAAQEPGLVRAQVQGQVDACSGALGPAFVGVRAVMLRFPQRSFFIAAKGAGR